MKFEHAATPFRYILYVHTGSLHKNFKSHVENSLLPPLCTIILTPPPLRSELSGQNLQPPLRIKWSRHKVAILTSFWTFLNWIYYRYILHGLKISSIHLKRSVIHLKRSVIHLKISKINFFFCFSIFWEKSCNLPPDFRHRSAPLHSYCQHMTVNAYIFVLLPDLSRIHNSSQSVAINL